MDDAVVRAKVDEYVKWDSLLSAAKKEIEKLKADFQILGLEVMKDRKIKQVEFWGNEKGKVVVTTAETPKLVSYNFLRQVIGDVLLKDFVKEETQYKMTEHFKRIVTAIVQGTYMEQSVDQIIAQITGDEKVRKTLRKKLKGKWEKDVENLQVIAGLSKKDAEHFAYFVQEAVNYDKIVHLLEAAGHEKGSGAFEAALGAIKHAVVVEETVKVGIESEGTA
ncbi:MAG: hypothetical protein K6U74_19285 [Firmicutes bacterium]|nr:hypothetical protein [Bacillota bacterium]